MKNSMASGNADLNVDNSAALSGQPEIDVTPATPHPVNAAGSAYDVAQMSGKKGFQGSSGKFGMKGKKVCCIIFGISTSTMSAFGT
jgi:hypothetical protein